MAIDNHQDLLNKFYEAERSVIGEFSGDMIGDTLRLMTDVDDYAERWGLLSTVELRDRENYEEMRGLGD